MPGHCRYGGCTDARACQMAPNPHGPISRMPVPPDRKRLAFDLSQREDLCAGVMFQSGQLVRVNLAGPQAEGVMFQAAVTDAVGHIVKQTSEQPPIYLVKLYSPSAVLPMSK